MRAYIFAFRFYNFGTNRPNMGGTQTYISELSEVLYTQGYDVHVLDEKKGKCDAPKVGSFNHFTVEEFYYSHSLNRAFHNYYKAHSDENTLFIIGDDEQDIYPRGINNLISIQHGIGWDYERTSGKKSLKFIFPIFKLLTCIRKVRKYYRGSNYVCVDYNYFNWLRTLYYIPKERYLNVIPNFASSHVDFEFVKTKLNAITDLKSLNIIFARRLQWYRGSIIWAKVVKRLSGEYPNLNFTIAGEGPCEGEVKKILNGVPSVSYAKFTAETSVEFHKKFDIAVVPTIFSEGTSLSACEAMAAGCLPIVSYVGGLSNIVIDNFNGRSFFPNEDELYKTVKEVLEMDIVEFRRMALRAYESTITTFSRDVWAGKWISVVNNVMHIDDECE